MAKWHWGRQTATKQICCHNLSSPHTVWDEHESLFENNWTTCYPNTDNNNQMSMNTNELHAAPSTATDGTIQSHSQNVPLVAITITIQVYQFTKTEITK
jgi:hypothetical protein